VLLETAELIDAGNGIGARQRRRVDIAAVALSFTQPYRTKRGDLTMSITLIDDSLQLCDNDGATAHNSNTVFIKSNNVNIFVDCKMGYLLPKLRESGDVVLMRNLELDKFNGEIQLVGHKRGSASYACYRRKDKNVMDKDGFSDAEAKRVDELWTWGQKRLRLHATMKQEHRFRIRDVFPQNDTRRNASISLETANRGDMFALITAIIPWDDDSAPPPKPKGFLRVWDGTGESTSDNLPLHSPIAMKVFEDGDPSDRAVACVAEVVRKLRADNPASTTLKLPGALAGRVVNVAIWEPQHWQLVESGHLKVGLFIRMRNIVETMSERLIGIRCLNVQTKSSFTITPPLTYEVVKLVEDHNQRLLSGEPTNPASGILPMDTEEDSDRSVVAAAPRGGHPQQSSTRMQAPSRLLKGSSLRMELLHKFASAPQGAIFDGIVQLTDIFPPVEQARERGLDQMFCRTTTGTIPKVYYQFALRVEQEDSATVLEAILSDKDKQIPIGPLLFSSSAEDAIKDSTKALTQLQANLSAGKRWKALLHSSIVDGKKYFFVASLAPLD
jgi:Telomeric single stranded DNA binding POT1/CDC13